MKLTRPALAGLLALLTVAPAAAQQFPTLPAQTVIGRLGIPGDSGPSQAIPLSILFQRVINPNNVAYGVLTTNSVAVPAFTHFITLPNEANGGAYQALNNAGAAKNLLLLGDNTTAGNSTRLRSAGGGVTIENSSTNPIASFLESGQISIGNLSAFTPAAGALLDVRSGSINNVVTNPTLSVPVLGFEPLASLAGVSSAVTVSSAGSSGGTAAVLGQIENQKGGVTAGLQGGAKDSIGAETYGMFSTLSTNTGSSGRSGAAGAFFLRNTTGSAFTPNAGLYSGTTGVTIDNEAVVAGGPANASIGLYIFGLCYPGTSVSAFCPQGGTNDNTFVIGANILNARDEMLRFGSSAGNGYLSPSVIKAYNSDSSVLYDFTNAGTLKVNTTPGTAAQGLFITQSGPTSGTTAGVVSSCTAGNPALVYNSICITNEGASVTGATDPKYTYGNNIAMITGGTNSTGGKYGQNVFLYKATASTPSTARDHVALNAHGLIDAGDGGTGTAIGQSKGTMFGVGCSSNARSGATNLLEVSCMEADVGLATGSSASYRFGINFVDNGNIQAAVQDAAISIGSAGGPGWGKGILWSDLNGGMPACTTCTLIKSDTSTTMTVDSAIDFGSNVSITHYLLRGPGGYIDGQFNIVGASVNLGGPGLSSGVFFLKGTASGTAAFNTQAVQGTPNISIPTGSGTLVTSVTAPIVIDPVTGRISCPTCSTTSGGGSIATLTFGTHLTSGGASYNGSTGVTITSDATNANTASTIVARDGSGNFSAGTITASLTGHASLDLALTGGTMSGAIAMGGSNITGAANVAASTFNGNTFTTGTGVLTIAASKTLTASNTLTFTGTDGSSVAFGTGGTVLYGNQTITLSGDVSGSGATAITTTLTTAQPAVHTWALAQTFTVAPVFTDQSGSRTALGLGTMATQAASSVAVTGGTIAGLTGLAVRDTSAAFDLTIAGTSSAALTAGRKLTLDMGNVAHTLAFGTTANTITFPNAASDTVAMLGVANTFTASQTISFAGSSQLTAKSTGANSSFIGIDTSQATLQSGFALSDNGTLKWQFIKQTDNSFLIFDTANSIVAQTVTPGATTVGSVNFGYTKPATTTTSAAVTMASLGVAGAMYGGAEIATGATVVGSLPTCNAAHKAARHFVTDANATFAAGIGAVVATGGANNVPVTCDGTNWRIGANDNNPLQQMRKFA